MSNLLLQTDSYKLSHYKQYPPKTQYVYSYMESRGGQFDNTVFFGLQYLLKKYLVGKVFTPKDIEVANSFAQAHFGRNDSFNYTGWYQLWNKYEGTLPIRIKAVPEGTVVPVKNVLMTIENTDAEFPWLTNYLETILMKVWYPTTVATLSREIKKLIMDYHTRTGSDPSGIPFKLHDFGYRGVSSEETAAIGGAAHLLNFQGTDTIAGILMLQDYYSPKAPDFYYTDHGKQEVSGKMTNNMYGFSIPAAEHSTITSWGKENEYQAMKNMLDQYPGTVAIVSDSYDLSEAVNIVIGWKLRNQIINRDGVVVVRPDSGDPASTVANVLEWLSDKFGYTVNDKGFKVLNPHVRVIQGDGVNYESIRGILAYIHNRGWAAENVAFGMGGALLQQLNRDTQRFAIKCSSITVDGVERDVWKETKTDTSKASKRGRLVLGKVGPGYDFVTVKAEPGLIYSDQLKTVYENGELISDQTVDEIRKRVTLN
jgi:nicotinamide phosphoribosyltransferase